MPTLTPTQLAELASLVPTSYEDFETTYWAAMASEDHTPAELYYQYLSTKGFAYGDMALGVVRNDTDEGRIANLFAEKVAAGESVDLSFQSNGWLLVQYELMAGDYDLRQSNGGNDLSFQNQLDNHAAALDFISVSPKAFTPLSQIAEHDPVQAQLLWLEIVDSNGLHDSWFSDGLLIGFTANVASNQTLTEIRQDYVDQTVWYATLLGTLGELGVNTAAIDLAGLDTALGAPVSTTVEAFCDFLDAVGKTAGEVSAWLSDVWESAEGGFTSLPTWYSSAIEMFRLDLTGVWDPLVIDIDGDGLTVDFVDTRLTDIYDSDNPVYFDLDGDGFAQATEWHKDAFLARDLNENGRIDSGAELFDTATQNGFAALAAFDGNLDGKINSADAVWADLVLWKDTNLDGHTQQEELLTLAAQNINAINLAATATGHHGLSHTGTVTTTTGALAAGNYNFTNSAVNARYAADYDFDIRAAFLPTLRGYNAMPDMHIALSLDNDEVDPASLMALMQDLASYSMPELFENWADVKETIEGILYRWAGVEDINPTSRGTFIADARIVEFLEEYLGSDFVDRNVSGDDPGLVQAQGIEDLWYGNIFARLCAQILFESGASGLFDTGQSYDLNTDEITGTKSLSVDALNALESAAAGLGSTAERLALWMGVGEYLRGMQHSNYSAGLNEFGLSSGELALLTDAVEGSDSALTWATGDHNPSGGVTSIEYRLNNPVGETYTGTGSANSITGSALEDIIIGGGGADNLVGGAGNDTIYGHNIDCSGDDGAVDTIDGGAGDDTIYGGNGNDILYGGESGSDHLMGGVGNDLLQDGHTGGAVTQNLLEGGEGNDEYRAYGSAVLTVADSSGEDLISTHYKMTEASIVLSRFGNDSIKVAAHNALAGQSISFIIVDQIAGLE